MKKTKNRLRLTSTALLGAPAVTGLAFGLESLDFLRTFDLGRFYNSYGQLVDFSLFAFLFIALAFHTIGKRLGGRAGKSASIVLGLMLATSLSLMENALSFNLRSLGPAAGGLVILAIGMVLFLSVRKLGVHSLTAAALAVLLISFSVSAISPDLYGWVLAKAPWLSLLFLLCVLIFAIRVSQWVWKVAGSKSPYGFRREEKSTRVLETAAKSEGKAAGKMVKTLKKVSSAIRQGGEHQRVTTLLRDVQGQEEQLLSQLFELKQLSERLRSLDIAAYHKLRKQLKGTQLKEQRKLLKKELYAELDRLQVEKQIGEYEKILSENVLHARNYLKLASTFLDHNEGDQALTVISKAEECLLATQSVSREMRKLDRKLRNLFSYEQQIAKKRTQKAKKNGL